VILAAALLVLAALGLFLGGLATGAVAFYWACVALSAFAAVLLLVAHQGMSRAAPARGASPGTPAAGADGAPPSAPRHLVREERDDGLGRGDGVATPDLGEPVGTVAGPLAADLPDERTGGPAGQPAATPDPADDGEEPPVEEVEVTDLLLVVDLRDEVLVVDEHPRYHVAGCSWLTGRAAVPLPLDEARTDGFTPCGRCTPDRRIAELERARRAGGRTP
jgi:hypothetical protein